MSNKHAETALEASEITGTTNTPSQVLGSAQSEARAPEKPFSQEEVDRLRAVGGGGPRKFGLSRLPDGSFRLDVTIPVELSACLESQADGAQEPLETYIQRMVVEGLESILGSNA
jgi:hypothetical protein